ncbi:MAG TPA: OmpH family outer membrane protein [bacterium]
MTIAQTWIRQAGRWGLAAAAAVAPWWASGPAAAQQAPQEFRIGYVDVSEVFDGYERTKASDATLTSKGEQRESELQGRVEELTRLRDSLELLSAEARDARVRQLEEKADAVRRFRTNVARDLQRERDDIAREILKDIHDAIQEYAKSHGYTLILDQRSLVYGQPPAEDVTPGVLSLLNSRYKGR